MSLKQLSQAPPLWIEVRAGSVHVHNGREGVELPAVWDAQGAPDAATRPPLLDALARLAPRRPWQSRGRVWCALPARGVSLRTLNVPDVRPADLHRVLRLQVEAAFPLPPDQLAWGWIRQPALPAGPDGTRRVQVAAVRRDLVAGLAAYLADAGFDPVFTVAPLVRNAASGGHPAECVAVDVGPVSSDLVDFRDGVPVRLRVVAWGHARIAGAVAADLGIPAAEAGTLVDALAGSDALPAARREGVAAAAGRAVQDFAGLLRNAGLPPRVRLSVPGRLAALVGTRLAAALAPTAVDARPEAVDAPGLTPAIAAMQAAPEPALRLDAEDGGGGQESAEKDAIPWKWVARAAVLAVALGVFPYAEAFIGGPILSRRLDRLSKDRARLGEIDRRLEFLQYLADNQPPYVEASYVVANAAPPGTRIESVSMNRRGEVSVSGYTQMPQQAVEFRTRLVDSGYFSGVVLEELAPVVGGQPRINVRVTAQWKAAADREALKLGPALPGAAATNAPAGRTNTPAPNPPPAAVPTPKA